MGRALGLKSLMIVNYNGRPTESNWVILQHVCRCNVVYAYTLSNVIWGNIVTVHT
jgi:hypothetical protein